MNEETQARAALDGAVTPPKGRPNGYSDDFVETFLTRIASGETLKGIAREDGMPSVMTINRWLAKHEEFQAAYDLACKWRSQGSCDEIREVARATVDDGLKFKCHAWLLSKEIPEKYGDNPVANWRPDPALMVNGDNAKVVNESQPQIIHQDPLHAQIAAWDAESQRLKSDRGKNGK